MATFNSDLINRNLRHRGTVAGREYTISGRLRVKSGASIATTDLIRMVPLGESQRPIRIVAWVKAVTGTPVLTNATFSFGISPVSASNLVRPDNTVYTPVTASATRLGAATALSTDEMVQLTEIDSVTDTENWAPFYVTMTPAGAGAFSVAGGDVDIVLEVVAQGEIQTADPVYTTFLNTKYKN